MNTRTKILLTILWLAPLTFAPFRQYAMEHDSVNFALAISNFDIALHQPQPPGFPYWVMALKALSWLPLTPVQAQTLLAFLFSLATFVVWRRLDPGGEGGNVFLVLFSPVAWFYAAAPATNIVSLAFACAFLIFAIRAWNGDARAALWTAAVAGIWSGFRSAAPMFLVPLIVVCGGRARSVMAPVGAFVLLWLAWYVPVVAMTGGYSIFTGYMADMTRPTFAQSSVFYGASWRAHLESDLRVVISLFLMSAPLLLAVVLSPRRSPGVRIVEDRFWLFATLYAAPLALFATMIHGSKPGYLLLLLPLAVLAVVGRVQLNRRAWAATVAASVALSFFPYERVLNPETAYQFTRATLRSLFLIEDAQRAIAAIRPAGTATVLTNRREAPNLRSVRYHFPSAQWTGEPGSCIVVSNPWHRIEDARLVSSNPVYALWRRECLPPPSGAPR